MNGYRRVMIFCLLGYGWFRTHFSILRRICSVDRARRILCDALQFFFTLMNVEANSPI